MTILDQAHRLAAQNRMGEAVALVAEAANAGDAEAQFALANWRLFGLHGPRDPREALRLVGEAAAERHEEAMLLQACLLANGAAGTADEAAAEAILRDMAPASEQAREQLAVLDQMDDAGASPKQGEMLNGAPHVRAVREFLSPAETDYLMRRSERHLRPSFITNPLSGRPVPHPTRTSFGMNFGPSLEDLAVRQINKRIAEVTGTDVAAGEPLHILRYAPGQEYKPHLDTLPGAANNRAWTMLIYLNDGYEGGETVFDKLGLRFRGKAGDALVFASLDGEGRPDPRARHAGLPIASGVKWLATRWIRQSPVDPFS